MKNINLERVKKRKLINYVFLCFLGFLLSMITVQTFAQGIAITGTVSDNEGTLAGVAVVVKGTTTGAISDIDGKFSINVPNTDAILQFSYIGYLTTENVVGNQRTINVVLREDTQIIDEIVVIGYGVARRSDITGSVARADLSARESAPITNVADALRGLVPGLNIGYGSSGNNRAGNSGDINVSIRGRNSLGGSTMPLIVVDGVIYRGNIDDLNMSDIQSIDVLKDASSVAIYGSQAANGVLMITSKSVKTIQRPTIEYNGNFGIQKVAARKKDMWGINREDYVWQIESWDWLNSRLGPDYIQKNPDWDITRNFRLTSQREGWVDGTDTPWMELGTIDMPYILNQSVSIRGRGEAVNYFLSFGLMDEKRLIINDKFRRYNFRVNLETDLTKWLTIGMQAFFSIGDTSGQTPDMGSVAGEIPLIRAYNNDGTIWARPDRGSINILTTIQNEDLNMRYRLNGNFYANVNLPIEGLIYRVQFAPNLNFSRQYRFDYTQNGDTGQGYKNYTYGNMWSLDHQVNYIRKFGIHNVNATAVYGVDKRVEDGTNSRANNFTDMTLHYNNLGGGLATINEITSTSWEEASLWWMGRLIYTLKDRYVLTGTIRHDGFSGFGEKHKTGNFPSAALAWRISEEDFFKTAVPMVEMLKFRVSYGKAGNRTAGRYSTLAQMGVYNPFRSSSTAVDGIIKYPFGDGATPQLAQGIRTMANPNLKWETSASFNIGADFALYKGRLSGTYDFYYKKTTDLIYNIRIPAMNGAFPMGTDSDPFIEVATNIGTMQNVGHEFSLIGIPVQTKDLRWTVTFNYSRNRNKILSIYDSGAGTNTNDLINAGIFIGHPYGVNYDYKIIGMYQLEDERQGTIKKGAYPGTYKFLDVNGDGELKPEDDKMILSYRDPSFAFNIRNYITYKGFDLNIIINSIQGGKDFYYGRPAGDGFSENNSNYYSQPKHDWWLPENPNARYKRLDKIDAQTINSTPYVSRSFIRLQELSIGYSLPKSMLNIIGVRRARVFVSGTNLLTLTDWDGWDPEAGQGLDLSTTYPVMKVYSVGLNFEL